MSKDAIIQKLFDEVDNINMTYITIISIVLVLISIAFGILTWLQIRLSKSQFSSMKAEVEQELSEKYQLEKVGDIRRSLDMEAKEKLYQSSFRITYLLSKNRPVDYKEQVQIIQLLESALRYSSNIIKVNDRNIFNRMVYENATMFLNHEEFNLDASSKISLQDIIEKTAKYKNVQYKTD